MMMYTYFNVKSYGSHLKWTKKSSKKSARGRLPVPRTFPYNVKQNKKTHKDLAPVGNMTSVSLYVKYISSFWERILKT